MMDKVCATRYDTVRIIPHQERLFLFLEKYDTDFIYLIRLKKNYEFFSVNLNKPVWVINIANSFSFSTRLESCQRITSYYEEQRYVEQRYVEETLYNRLTHIEGLFTYVTKINKNDLQKDTPGTYLSTHNCSVIYKDNIGKILVYEVYQSLNESFTTSKSYPSKYDRLYEDMFEFKQPLKQEFMPLYCALEHPPYPVLIKPNF